MARRASPTRTCVGCRQRALASELLRVVAGEHGVVQADPRHKLPGRGAHLHPDSVCLAQAERRRAFGRALRIAGVLDTGPLVEYLGIGTAAGGVRVPHPDSKVGRPT